MKKPCPKDWIHTNLGEVLTFQRGFDITIKQLQPGEYDVIFSSGFGGNHNEYKVKAPGVVIGRKGSLGTVFFAKKNFWATDTTLWVKDFHGNDERFAYYFLKTMHLEQYDCGASNPTLNRNHIHVIPVCFPPVATQRKIAGILSAYDDLIENNTRRIKILEDMAQLLYREWFVNFRFPGHQAVPLVESELGLIPQGWEVVSFTDIADVMSGGTPKTTVSEYWNGQIPFFTPKDMKASFYILDTEKTITEQGLRKCNSKLYPKDTVFITERGTVGKVIMPAIPMAMNQTNYALRGRNGIGQHFIFLCILSCVEQLKKSATGAVFDTIVIDTFRLLKVIFPASDMTDRFNLFVKPIFDQILNLQRKNANLQKTRDLLLPKLISGEIDVESLDSATEADLEELAA